MGLRTPSGCCSLGNTGDSNLIVFSSALSEASTASLECFAEAWCTNEIIRLIEGAIFDNPRVVIVDHLMLLLTSSDKKAALLASLAWMYKLMKMIRHSVLGLQLPCRRNSGLCELLQL